MNKKIVIIGAGFSSLSAACYLAKAGYEVVVLEKNEQVGGRARQLKKEGFCFDIGPTFYWMPDVFDAFFNDFGKKTSDYYQLDRLSPAYQVYFEEGRTLKIADNFDDIQTTFEQVEKGSAKQLSTFMKNAKSNYEIAIKDLVYQPGESIFEIITFQTFKKIGLFIDTIKNQVARTVQHRDLQKVMEFPVLFLGAKASNTPAFYNFMNYADFVLGTWHPHGGMYKVVEAMFSLAKSLGVKFETNCSVEQIVLENQRVSSIKTTKGDFNCDILLSGADYAHTEKLLPEAYRQYNDSYWNKRTFAPSALLFYVAFDKKIENVSHHTLFFDTDFETHAATIYDTCTLPESPLFYASFPSKTDNTCAPEGKEAGIFLIPLAPNVEDSKEIREHYFKLIINRLENLTKQNISENILFYESFGVQDFIKDYNSYKGNAYGLANTLLQTHILRPSLRSKKVKNLFFTGQLTVPGPGVPPSLISGKIVSQLICA